MQQFFLRVEDCVGFYMRCFDKVVLVVFFCVFFFLNVAYDIF